MDSGKFMGVPRTVYAFPNHRGAIRREDAGLNITNAYMTRKVLGSTPGFTVRLRFSRSKFALISMSTVVGFLFPAYGVAQSMTESGVSDVPPIPSWVQSHADTADMPNVARTNLRTALDSGSRFGQTAVSLNKSASRSAEPSIRPLPSLSVQPPTPPNPFQQFVADTTEQKLPIFGQILFSGPEGQGYAPAENIPAPGDYVIGPGDEVDLQVWGGVDGDLHLTVDRNGQITIPKVGAVTVAGARASELSSVLKREISRVYTRFELSASLGKLRSIQIYVVGQASHPGAFTVSSLSTVVNALFATGGPGPNGSMRRIELRRGGALISTLDLYGFITKGKSDGDVHLLPGDTIVIPPTGPRVALLGALNTPAIYELKSANEPLGQVLGYAGGTTALTSRDKVTVERINDPNLLSASRSVEDRNLDDIGLKSTVQDGDVITLQKINPAFTNAITLRGNVAAALRYPYQPGMHVSDLLPEPAALLTADYFKRKNVLVQLVRPEHRQDTSAESELSHVQTLLDEPNWNYAVVERMDPSTLTTKLIPFNLGAVVHKTDLSQDVALKPGDIVTVFGSKDMRLPQADHTRLVRVDGEVRAAGVYELQLGDTVQSILRRAGGTTQEAYLFGTEFSREQTKQKQRANLDEAISRADRQSSQKLAGLVANLASAGNSDALVSQIAAQQQAQLARLRSLQPNGRVSLELSTNAHQIGDLPDVPMENGDAIYVPPLPTFVTVVGAVNNDNALIWKPNRTISDALKVAGVQPDIADRKSIFLLRADGSIFSRSSAGWFSSFESTTLMPGDTVVVPEKLDPRSPMAKFMVGLKDWSSVLANFGLGAAAISVLK
jgi:protein involved in polysaccharide export with SLBB domain